MKKIGTRMLMACSIVLALLGGSACDDDNSTTGQPTVTVLLSRNGGEDGKGNNDYSALIYKGIEKWQKSGKVKMEIFVPKNNEEAAALYHEWAERTANKEKALMIPANGQFAYMVGKEKLELKGNQQVLAFEMALKQPMQGVHCFEISHAGVAYLAGKMASAYDQTAVIVGHETPMLLTAKKQFHMGYGKDRPMGYAQLDESSFAGFNQPEKAKTTTAQFKNSFILPLAGLSNVGVYDYLKECKDEETTVAAGMDVNCNSISRRIAFSYLVNIDKAIDEHIQCWYDGKPFPNGKMGLHNGMTEIVINPDFCEAGGVTKAQLKQLLDENLEAAKQLDK